MQDIQQIISEVVSKVPDTQVMSDLDAAADWAAKNGGNRLEARDHGLLLGRTHRLDVCRAQRRI